MRKQRSFSTKFKRQVVELIGCKEDEILMGSAKSGVGTQEVLEAIVQRIPAPKGDAQAPHGGAVPERRYAIILATDWGTEGDPGMAKRGLEWCT
jgi:translation elongation factor EF-4